MTARWNFLIFLLAAALVIVPDAAGQKRRKIECYTCRDARFIPCEDHAAAESWCEEHFFYCSECIRKHPCCRGRGLTPCRCVDHDWENTGSDWGYGRLDKCIEDQRELVDAMEAKPMYALTEHFLLISTMESLKFSPGDVAEWSDEFDELKRSFPWIFRNVHQLSPHAVLHLYALRLEKIYEKYCYALGMTVDDDRDLNYSRSLIEVFLASPVKHKEVWQSRNNGAALVSGGTGKFILAQKDVGGGARNRKFFGPKLSGDWNFYDGVCHLTARCLIDRYFCSARGGKFPPGWIQVGFPHWMEQEILEQCSYYLVHVEIKGLGEEWVTEGWNKKARSQAARTKRTSFPMLSKKDYSYLGFKEHVLSWSYLDFLLKNQPRDLFRKYCDCLSKRMSSRDALMEAYGWSELTLEQKWRRSLIGGADEDAELAKAERFLAEFDRSRNHPDLETRASAAYYLKFCDNLEAARRILIAFTDKDVLVRASALDALKQFVDDEAVLWVVENGLTHSSDKVRRNTAIALGSFPEISEISTPFLLKLLEDGKGPVRAGAVRALGELHPDEVYIPLAACADDSSPEVRVEVALALGHYKRDDALTQVLKLFRDPVWAVRLAAIRAMHNIQDKRIIPALIEQLGKEDGRLREDIHDLLVKHTNQDFQLDSGRWQWWWNNYGEAFVFKTNKVKRRMTMKYALQYHEVETCSKKFIFLLDISSSMNEEINVKRQAGRTYTKGDLRQKKIEVAKNELVRLVNTFDKTILFNIITFAKEVETWKKKVAAASKGTKRNAENYVREIKIPDKSATNIYDALMMAFDMVDEGFDKRKYESVVDTMFLLSDGNPTAGTVTDVDMILRTIRERNRIHGIKIHTFALGGRADTYFLKKLADQTGGQYRVIHAR